jgi:hypothetical protein
MGCPSDRGGNPLYAPRSGNRRRYRNGNRGTDLKTTSGLNHCTETANTAKETGDTKITQSGTNRKISDITSNDKHVKDDPTDPKPRPNTTTPQPHKHGNPSPHPGTRHISHRSYGKIHVDFREQRITTWKKKRMAGVTHKLASITSQ